MAPVVTAVRPAQRLKNLRLAMGLSQHEIAREFRVTATAVSLWENGRRAIPGPVLRLLELYEAEVGSAEVPGLLRQGSDAEGLVATWLAPGSGERGNDVRSAIQRFMLERLTGALARFRGKAVDYVDMLLPPRERARWQERTRSLELIPEERVRRILTFAFGRPPEAMFEEFSFVPLARCSVGQVHAARRKGGDVVVKIRHPALTQSLRTDAQALELAGAAIGLLFPSHRGIALGEELATRLQEELDLGKEAENQRRAHALFAHDREVLIPEVYDPVSPTVMISRRCTGRTFDELATHGSAAERDAAGRILFRVAWTGMLRHGFFNADPSPSNFLFDGGRVACLDFGCVKRHPPALTASWRNLIDAFLRADRAGLEAALFDIGIYERGQRFDLDAHIALMRLLHAPLLGTQPCTVTAEFVDRAWSALKDDNPNKFKARINPDWLFVNRAQWGLNALLARLRPTADWRALMREILDAPAPI